MGAHLCLLLLWRFFCGEYDGGSYNRGMGNKSAIFVENFLTDGFRNWGFEPFLKSFGMMIYWDLKVLFSTQVSPDTVNVLMGSTAVSVDKVIVHSGYSQSGVFFIHFLLTFCWIFFSWWNINRASIWHFVRRWCLKELKIRWLIIFRRWKQHCLVETCSSLQGVTTLPSCSGLHSHFLLHIYTPPTVIQPS